MCPTGASLLRSVVVLYGKAVLICDQLVSPGRAEVNVSKEDERLFVCR